MSKFLEDEEIINIFETLCKFFRKEIDRNQACKKLNINSKALSNYMVRIFMGYIDNKKKYNQNIQLANELSTLNESEINKILVEKGIKRSYLRFIESHIKMLKRIKKLTGHEDPLSLALHKNTSATSMENEKMNFIPIKYNDTFKEQLKPTLPENIKSKNFIELKLSDDIKVLISNNVQNEQILKIINLLKDL